MYQTLFYYSSVHDLQAFGGQKVSLLKSLFEIHRFAYLHVACYVHNVMHNVKKQIFSFQFNLSHVIRHLSFGQDYPGIINPLDQTSQTSDDGMLWLSNCLLSFVEISVNQIHVSEYSKKQSSAEVKLL